VTDTTAEGPDLPALSIVYDISVRSFEALDRRLDTIGTRAATLLALTSLILTSTGTVVGHFPRNFPRLRYFVGAVLVSAIWFLIYPCVQAYRGRPADTWPNPRKMWDTHVNDTEEQARTFLISMLADQCSAHINLCEQKSMHLRRALWTFVVLVAILIPLSVLLPWNNP